MTATEIMDDYIIRKQNVPNIEATLVFAYNLIDAGDTQRGTQMLCAAMLHLNRWVTGIDAELGVDCSVADLDQMVPPESPG